MSNQTPMEDLLKQRVDSVEETADELPEPKVEAPKPEPEVKEKPEAKPEAVTTGVEPDGTEEGAGKRPVNLPKWAHERMRANDEKAAAALRDADEARREAETERQRAKELDDYIRNNGREPPTQQQEQFDPKQAVAQAVFETRNEMGWERAVEKYGPEYASQATHWANDMARTDPAFREQAFRAADPVAFSIRKFKEAQSLTELAKFGGDLDALVAARTKANPPVAKAEEVKQPAAGDSGALPTDMPSDFAGTASSRAQPNATTRSGPTPLGDLLKISKTRG